MIKNIPEARALAKRYREITVEDIYKTKTCLENCLNLKSFKDYAPKITNELTGFGGAGCGGNKCSLCEATKCDDGDLDCSACIYKNSGGCHEDNNGLTYLAIRNAPTPEALIQAFRDRADRIDKVLEGLEPRYKVGDRIVVGNTEIIITSIDKGLWSGVNPKENNIIFTKEQINHEAKLLNNKTMDDNTKIEVTAGQIRKLAKDCPAVKEAFPEAFKEIIIEEDAEIKDIENNILVYTRIMSYKYSRKAIVLRKDYNWERVIDDGELLEVPTRK